MTYATLEFPCDNCPQAELGIGCKCNKFREWFSEQWLEVQILWDSVLKEYGEELPD